MSETNTTSNSTPNPSPAITEEKLTYYKEKLRLEQNLIMGLGAGAAACLVGALLWAVISVSTGYQIGYMAIGVGLLVGFSIRYVGKGIDQIFGIIGGAFALLGCVLGNFFSVVAFLSNELSLEGASMSYFQVLSVLDFSMLTSLMTDTASPMDLLFYGLAIYEGYKFSFREITEEELRLNAS